LSQEPISRLDLPYQNLILTGFVGVGKTTVGKAIADKLEVDFMDVDEEIVRREGMSIRQIRQEFGDARLKILEADVCRESAFRRQAVIVVSGAALLDQRNADLLGGTGQVACLTCEMGEALRRLHMAYEETFRDPKERQHLLSRLRREYGIVDDERHVQIDTTHLTIEEVVDELVHLWQYGEPMTASVTATPSRRLRETEDSFPKRTEVSRRHPD
jgi:shikimate kinase